MSDTVAPLVSNIGLRHVIDSLSLGSIDGAYHLMPASAQQSSGRVLSAHDISVHALLLASKRDSVSLRM